MPAGSTTSTGGDNGPPSLEFGNTRTASPSPSPSPTPPPAPVPSASVTLLSSASGTPSSTSSAGRSGSRGPIGPKPGVFRPCARCRQKKTKCDRLKPTCSNCKKGGADVLCVYDNDEPTEGVITTHPSEYAHTEVYEGGGAAAATGELPSVTLLPTTASSTSKGSRGRPIATTSALAGSAQLLSGPLPASPSTPMTSYSPTPTSTTAGDGTRISFNNSGTEKSPFDQPSPVGVGPTASPAASPSQPSSPPTSSGRGRRGKALAGTSTAIKPSPLRTSSLAGDTAHSPSPTSPTNASLSTDKQQQQQKGVVQESQSPAQKPSKRASKKTIEDIVTGLSIKDQQEVDENVGGQKRDDDAASDAGTPAPTVSSIPSKSRTLTSASANGSSGGHQSRTTASGGTGSGGSNNSGSSKLLADLAAAAARAPPPAPPLVIDANQRARKWGRPRIMFRTLGGEVGLPLWISEQEMLLNNPKQTLYVNHEQLIQQHQKERAFLSSATTAGAGGYAGAGDRTAASGERGSGGGGRGGGSASLSRLTALKHLDPHGHHHRRRRTSTPDRGNTPDSNEGTPAPTSAPKKRRSRKHHQVSIDSSARSVVDSDVEMLEIGEGEEGEEGEGTGDEVSVASSHQHHHHRKRQRRTKKRKALDDGEEGESAMGGGRGTSKEKGSKTPRTLQQGPSPRPRTFKCSYPDCPKSFMDQVQLDRHERRHGTDDFECGIDGCTKMYSSISTMRRHQSMVHKRRQPPIIKAREGAIPFTASAVLRKRAQNAALGISTDDGRESSMGAYIDDDDDGDDDDEDEDDDDEDIDEEEDDDEEGEDVAAAMDEDEQEQEDEGEGSTAAGDSPRRPTPYSAGSTAPSSPLHDKRVTTSIGHPGASSKMAHLLNAPELPPPLSSSRQHLSGDTHAIVVGSPVSSSSLASTPGSQPAESSMAVDRD